MNAKYRRSLHVFRRDLRLDDNTALCHALADSVEVSLLFVFDRRQFEEHAYRSTPALHFMLNSLEELNSEALMRFGAAIGFAYGEAEAEIPKLAAEHGIEAVFFNRDYTPFGRRRDQAIHASCKQLGVATHQFGDALLHEPEEISKPDRSPYTVYTPFFKRCTAIDVRPVNGISLANFSKRIVGESLDQVFGRLRFPVNSAPRPFRQGGRREALQIIANLDKHRNYARDRDFPALPGTSGLSPHNKFGTCSIREVYWAARELFGAQDQFIRELYWRDFFTHIAFHHPLVFKAAFQQQYNNLQWDGEIAWLQAWKNGETGFPIVDAGMRELSATGYMHNRVRMITASFLVKDLLIDWHEGEKFFAQHLIDYDPSVNNGSWQWAASTGCDAQPYFRIFNPWLQQKKFDADCRYIKRWVPELESLSASDIHALESNRPANLNYPAPIVSHSIQRRKAEELFRAASR